jgi:flagellar basal body P-ring formation protein FlgA
MKYINTKKICNVLLYFIIFSFVLCSFAIGEEEFSIIVKKTSKVNSEDVYLKDIAEIKAPSFLEQEIGEIVVATSPEPGEIKIILKDRLTSKIYSNHLVDKNVLVNVPEKIYIKRQTQKLEQDYIKECFLKYVGTFHDDIKFDLRDFSVRGIEPYPDGELALLFDRNNRFEGKGRFSIRVDVLIDNLNIDTLSIAGWVDVYEQFVCARVPIKRNTKIQAESLYYKNINISKARHQYAKSIEEVAGTIPNRNINQGDLIKTSSLKQAPLVRKGEAIKLIAKREGLKIITAGISKEDGIKDALIKVENLSSGKVIRGLVKGESTVEVYY